MCVLLGGKRKKLGNKNLGNKTLFNYIFNTFLTWATKHTIQQIHSSPVSKTWDKAQLQPISKYMYQQTTHLFLREKKLYIYIYIFFQKWPKQSC